MTVSVYRNDSETQRSTGTDWVRWLDVRLPVTIEEGQSALDLIATKIAGLESQVLSVPGRALAVEYATQKWEERRAEIEWSVERLRAGEPVASMELAKERAAHAETTKKLDAARSQVKSLESKVMTLANYRRTEASESKLGGMRTELERLRSAIDDRNATIDRLRAAPAATAAQAAAAIVKSEHRREVERLHETSAEALEALDSMVAAGAGHTPVSHIVWTKLDSSLPAGFRVRWRAIHFPRIAEAAAVLAATEAL